MGDAVQVTCDWQNDGPTRLGYPHEMCFAIGYFWPADAGLMCVSKGGSDECQCNFQGATDTGPGGATIAVKLTRAEKIDGVKGDPASGAPIYCSLFRAEDWDGFAPKPGKAPYYFRDQVDVPLKTSTDEAVFNITDVTPGDYVLSCFMDTISGGFGVGSGISSTASLPRSRPWPARRATRRPRSISRSPESLAVYRPDSMRGGGAPRKELPWGGEASCLPVRV